MQHTILNFINQHFFVGIDVHLKQWKVTIRSAGIELKNLLDASCSRGNSLRIFRSIILTASIIWSMKPGSAASGFNEASPTPVSIASFKAMI
jgi:hypothetical protein